MPVTEIATMAVVKQYLRIPSPSSPNGDDPVIQILMNAATRAIEREVGHIVPAEVTLERHDGGRPQIDLRELPVLYVRRVVEGWGYYDQDLDQQTVNAQPALSIWAYSLDIPEEGVLTRRGPGNVLYPFVHGRNNISVDYVAGCQAVPPGAEEAFLELVSIWYRQSQMKYDAGAGGGSSAVFNAVDTNSFTRTTAVTSVNFGVPDAILEMLKDGRRRPIIA